MNVPEQLDGAEVIKFTKNDATIMLSKMIFEEENGSTTEIPITALAIAKFENDDKYYLFLCDKNWEVQNDFYLETIEEAIELAQNNFFVSMDDWLTIA